MVSKYDVFHIIAAEGQISVSDIALRLDKPKSEYQNIFNNVLALEKEGYVKREGKASIVHSDKSKKLFDLISFCVRNAMNYNFFFKESTLESIKKASRKEFFTINDIKIHPQTYKEFVTTLNKYGFLLIERKKPLRCKLLRHHFLMDLLLFFRKSARFYTPRQASLMGEIEKEMRRYRNNQKRRPALRMDFERKKEANFIYSSLNLEGNPITLPETQKLILEKITPRNQTIEHINEISNYKKAMDLMIRNASQGKKLDLPSILGYHRLAMAHRNIAGTIRTENVFIKKNPNFKTADFKDVKKKLDDLLRKYLEFESRKRKIQELTDFAAYFHNEFQRIHPFIDGNSRISRLLMLYILRSHKVPMLDLPIGYFDLYLDLTKRSERRNDDALRYLIEEMILMGLKEINENY